MSENTKATPSEFEERLASIRGSFLSRLGLRLDEIARLWQEARANAPDLEPLRKLHRSVHALNGAAATFGLRSMSEVAQNLEGILDLTVNDAGKLNDELETRISEGLQALRSVTFTSRRPSRALTRSSREIVGDPDMSRDKKLVYMLGDDAFYQSLALQLENFGYEAQRFSALEALLVATSETVPDAFVIDDEPVDGGLEAVETVNSFLIRAELEIPVMFVSSKRNLAVRLEAVRAGVNAFVSKPIELVVFLDRLKNLLSEDDPEPARVLVVEDDPCLAEHNAALLEHAGMMTKIVTDPCEILGPLSNWNPELILMDLHMPGCTGLELASMIRQDETHLSIPIVFLSGESNVDLQRLAISRGGDDFLMKSIEPEHLISTITARVQRVRTLRSLIFRDALTGLFNHGAIMEQLDLEVHRARRVGTPMSFAIIDLDRFKSVNDTHGHATGSRVIKSAGRLLQQRTRKSDVIGRYGGEEFCVIMPGTPESGARTLLASLRSSWASVIHQSSAGEFHVTFSAGAVELGPEMGPNDLLEAADQALYAAKSSGRDQVVTASEVRDAAGVQSQ